MFEEVLHRVFRTIEHEYLNFTLHNFHFQLKIMSTNHTSIIVSSFDSSDFLGLSGIKWKVLHEGSCHFGAMDIHQIVVNLCLDLSTNLSNSYLSASVVQIM